MRRLIFNDGVAYLDGAAVDFSTWEYPYFRDSADNWAARLHQLRDLGTRVVSTYVPWRHHEVPAPGGYSVSAAGCAAEPAATASRK